MKPIGRKIRIPGIANYVQKGKEIKNLKKQNSPEALDGFFGCPGNQKSALFSSTHSARKPTIVDGTFGTLSTIFTS